MKSKHQGFTLIEVVVTLVLVSIIGLAFSDFTSGVIRGHLNAAQISAATEKTQLALMRISHEIANIDTYRSFNFSNNQITYYYRTDTSQSTIQLSNGRLKLNNYDLLDYVTVFTVSRPKSPSDTGKDGTMLTITITINALGQNGTLSKTFSTSTDLITLKFQQ
ncbi:prepilin-type N-terminal cleavage/methylation domain-containing protein [Solidesulfovibrio magneticus]|uniref:Prepilin-type N-terminal cleavage/methylation domain-containing protein n=1 Tax=Solidesulfovibrio magneticus (strain ATCC 700980 / DSM 13731 / RS-1) TaxID=573370 RepID=C4XKY5_SOLM1|nr:prepilin-type N-terminal cleavage/methylation domain-containing protein [Solidesulfovibrio magneticus]BAH74524.1 hypothetical protein DMR_10330 [Solidesulfovibrio magneticus RS-1]